MNENEERIISAEIIYSGGAVSAENAVPSGEEFLISVEIE